MGLCPCFVVLHTLFIQSRVNSSPILVLILAVAVGFLALVTALAALAGVILLPKAPSTQPGPAYDDSGLAGQVALLEHALDRIHAEYEEIVAWRSDIEAAVDEGIRDVKRTRLRIQATVRRAQEQLEDAGVVSPGVEAEAAELHDVDAGGGGGEGLPAVPASVDPGRARAIAALPGDWS